MELYAVTNDIIKNAITHNVINYAVTNDWIIYAVTNAVIKYAIKYAITNYVINKKIITSCFQIRPAQLTLDDTCLFSVCLSLLLKRWVHSLLRLLRPL